MGPPSKRFKYSNKIEIKTSIVDKFKNVINDIDIDAESLLVNLNDQSLIKRINEQRKTIVEEINKLTESTLENLDKNVQINQAEMLNDEDIFISSCAYFDTETLGDFILNKDRLGILVIFDYLMKEDYLEILKEDLILLFDKLLYSKDEFESMFPENMFLIELIRNALVNDQILLRVEKNRFQEIKEFSINHNLKDCDPNFHLIPNMNIFIRFSNLRKIFISGLDFITIREKWFINLELEELVLSNNGTVNIEKDAFFGLKSLKKLDLSKNQFSPLESGTFDNLTELEELDLSSNFFDSISGTLFKDLNSLKRLDISDTGINDIDDETLSSLSNLKELIMKNTNCIFTPNSLKNLNNLDTLVVSHNMRILYNSTISEIQTPRNLRKLTCFNSNAVDSAHLEWIREHPDLTEIILHIRSIELNTSFFDKFNNLQELVLHDGSLNSEKLPNSLNSLKKLKLDKIIFTKCVDNLFDNLNIEEILINACIFQVKTDLNVMISKSRMTRKLTIAIGCNDTDYSNDDNEVDEKKRYIDPYPNVIKLKMNQLITNRLSNLKELFVRKYTLDRNYEHTFKGLVNLEKLSIERNSLRAIHKNAFEGLTNLKDLSLADNPLESIDQEIFSPLENSLERLDIYLCNLKPTDLNKIENLRELKELNISGNPIDSIRKDTFRNLKKLEKLYLALTTIKKLEDNVFSDLTNLKKLDLSLNVFDDLEEGVFNGVEYLDQLDLSQTKIRKINHLFDKLKNIKIFLASNTDIDSIDIEKIENMKQIEMINLEDCKIKKMNYKLLNRLMVKKHDKLKINLNGNPYRKNTEQQFMNLLNLDFKV